MGVPTGEGSRVAGGVVPEGVSQRTCGEHVTSLVEDRCFVFFKWEYTLTAHGIAHGVRAHVHHGAALHPDGVKAPKKENKNGVHEQRVEAQVKALEAHLMPYWSFESLFDTDTDLTPI